MNFNCLVVDDEKMLAENTSEFFNLFDVKTTYVLNAEDCRTFLKTNTVDVILLDINLEESSGFELCRDIRKEYNTPILFISARSSDDDVIAALNIGGDDYIKKPYSLSVMLAKVKAVLKRYKGEVKNSKEAAFDNKGLFIDYAAGKVKVNNQEITLKAMEYKLLCYLAKNINRVVPKEEIFTYVWGDIITSDGTLNVHIRHLREKIEDNPNDPKRIKTVWGRGYILEEI